MKASKAVGVGAALLFITLWTLPMIRAVSYLRWAREYFAETGSIDVSNELRFSTTLVAPYGVSLLAAMALSSFLFRRSRLILLLPVGLLVFAVAEVIRLKPEAPIVLFPTMRPWKPALISLAAAGVATWFHFLARFERNEKNA